MARTKWANQFRKSRNAYPPRGGLLDNGQKARIAILAREAWDKLTTDYADRTDGESGFKKSASSAVSQSFTDWRREQQFLAVGKESLRDCLQGDYKKLEAHFLNIGGEPGRAVTAHMADAVSDKEVALRKLYQSLEERGLRVSYAEEICRDKCRGRGLDEANAKEIWDVNFTVRNRRKKITADHAEQTDLISASSEKSAASAVNYPF